MGTQIAACLRGLAILFTSASILLACASTPPPTSVSEPEAVDPFADFRGAWFEPGTVFRQESTPMANRGLGIEITLKKVEWTISETRDGTEVRDASVVLIVSQGEQSRRLRMDEGDTKSAFGATVEARKAGEDYSERLMQYTPWVDLHVQ